MSDQAASLTDEQHDILWVMALAASEGGALVLQGTDGTDGSALPVVKDLLRLRLIRWADHESLTVTMRGLRALRHWPVVRGGADA